MQAIVTAVFAATPWAFSGLGTQRERGFRAMEDLVLQLRHHTLPLSNVRQSWQKAAEWIEQAARRQRALTRYKSLIHALNHGDGGLDTELRAANALERLWCLS